MKKRIIKMLIVLVLAVALMFVFVSCNKNNSDKSAINPSGNSADAPDSGAASSADDAEETMPDRKIVYTAFLDMQSDDVAALSRRIRSTLGVDEWVEYQNEGSNYATLKLRVKTDRLEEFVSVISEGQTVTSYQKTAQDISINYYDTTARIDILTAERTRLIELSAQASSLADLFTIEKRLAEIQNELKKLNSTLNQYDSLVEYSTVSINISKPYEAPARTFGERVERASNNGWEGFKTFMVGFLAALPYLILITGVAVLIRFLVKRSKKKKIAKCSENSQQAPIANTNSFGYHDKKKITEVVGQKPLVPEKQQKTVEEAAIGKTDVVQNFDGIEKTNAVEMSDKKIDDAADQTDGGASGEDI